MFKPFEFCIPTKSTNVPTGPDWFHEIKYDGYRLRVDRDGDRVRLTRAAATTGLSVSSRNKR
jgi:ATP-dependent DNA ligase